MNNRRMRYLPGVLLAGGVVAIAASTGGCSAASNLVEAAQGCDEFQGGASSVASLSIDGDTKAFLTAAANLVTVANTVETSVLNACIAIDTDLGVPDTWTALKPTDGSAPDAELNEACNEASMKIGNVLHANASAQCSLAVTTGYCTVDASAQASCQGSCSGSASCTPPDITASCDPGEITGECDASCNASATCEGSVSVAANCQGSCQADCSGECDVTATAPQVHCEGTCSGNCTGTCDGNTASGASCAGKCVGQCDAKCTLTGGVQAHCEGSCTGKCTGNCTLAANSTVMCGAMVNCKGGCSVAYTAPKCEAQITPPSCMASASCKASCQSNVEVNAMCTPPAASLECSATASSDVVALVKTVETNLPAILAGFETQGKLAYDAAKLVVQTGSAVVSSATSLGGKAIACATVGADASVKATASVKVSVTASASVSGSCGGPSSS
jgi:hypothetical protein